MESVVSSLKHSSESFDVLDKIVFLARRSRSFQRNTALVLKDQMTRKIAGSTEFVYPFPALHNNSG